MYTQSADTDLRDHLNSNFMHTSRKFQVFVFEFHNSRFVFGFGHLRLVPEIRIQCMSYLNLKTYETHAFNFDFLNMKSHATYFSLWKIVFPSRRIYEHNLRAIRNVFRTQGIYEHKLCAIRSI